MYKFLPFCIAMGLCTAFCRQVLGQGTIFSQELIVVPNGFANVEGNSGGGPPFWTIAGDSTSARFQQVINSTEFATIDQGGWIQSIYIRANSSDSSGTSLRATYPQIQVNLSTTLRSADSLSSAFAENIGVDETVGLNATSFQVITDYGRPGSPQSFVIAFPLATPFFYDPSKGNLLLEIKNWEIPTFRPDNTRFPGIDGINQAGDSIGSVFGSSVSAEQGTVSSFGYIFQFGVVPIPEPSIISMLGLAVVIMGGFRYRSRPERIGHGMRRVRGGGSGDGTD